MSRTRIIRIATRSSPMALAQAEHVAELLGRLGVQSELVKVTTAGDRWMGDLSKLGGKGAFVKEIDHALLVDDADLAVHCLKDIPGDIPVPEGLAFAGYLARDDVHDAVITGNGAPLAEQPAGTVVGTSSVRRTAQLLLHYPHLTVRPLRGNVNTRLARLEEGHVDVLIAAVSGLHRVGQQHRITETLDLETMCPPIGAGIIALECRSDDSQLRDLGAQLDHAETHRQADAERAMLHALQGHCNSPIAGYATTDRTGRLTLHGKVFSADGAQWLDSKHWGVPEDPQALGFFVGADLLRQGARAIIDAIPH
ncbi:hydroxymethylbilane synthase [Nocardia brasiliensis]|uniref:hydroxymethylbilane synthase n=1 Tax=Nocardia brasiliensis TaxID=37326 RepID=UPI0004A76B73|nr:hydroxymethylbilane synthase [Nocardia brasiliensis]MBF6129734.1 hydroxymethylbilane synthase [Nocardia brasiliensis]MBF6542514.1 hydroxymethylbilane synthase [Nocardia brasiliensis]